MWTIKIDNGYYEYEYILSKGNKYSIQNIIDIVIDNTNMRLIGSRPAKKHKHTKYVRLLRKLSAANARIKELEAE